MKIPAHVIDGALDAANKKLLEVSKRISEELGAKMTKFKVGDRVTFSGDVVKEVRGSSILNNGYELQPVYRIKFSAGQVIDIQGGELTRSHLTDTTFRDQAAIAALQGILADKSNPGMAPNTAASIAFNLAEALNAERKKRDAS